MQAIIDLLVCLRRHESTARAADHQLSPREKSALQMQLSLVRGSIPSCVLDHYDRLKQSKRVPQECPVILAMATLVSVYQVLPPRKRRAMTSFFELAGYSPRH